MIIFLIIYALCGALAGFIFLKGQLNLKLYITVDEIFFSLLIGIMGLFGLLMLLIIRYGEKIIYRKK